MYYKVSLILIVICIIRLVFIFKAPKKIAKKNNQFADILKKTGFVESKRVEFWDNVLFVDDVSKLWCVKGPKEITPKIYKFSELVSYNYYETSEDVISGNSLDVLLAGKAYGEIGAIAASAGSKKIHHYTKTLKLVIFLNELNNSRIVINLTSNRIPRNYYNKYIDQVVDNMNDTLNYIRRNSSKIDDIFDILN